MIEGLEANRDPNALLGIMPFLRDGDHRLRANAVKALQSFGVERVMEELHRMATDPRVPMRDGAIYVLSGIKTSESARLLGTLLRDPQIIIRRNAIKALALQGLKGNIAILKEFRQTLTSIEETGLADQALAHLERTTATTMGNKKG